VGGSIYSTAYTPTQAAQIVSTIFAQRIGTRCHPGGRGIEALNATTFWQTFTVIFSYEKWSAPGPPLYLMGNPDHTYTNAMWSEFVFSFKHSLQQKLATYENGSLCKELSETVLGDMTVGVYWARKAIEAWNITTPV